MMNRLPFRHSLVLVIAALSLPVLTGANNKGCGGDVVIGEDTECVVTGCSGQICADGDVATTCEWTEAYACYADHGICERDANGVCGWRPTAELEACLDAPAPEPCVVTGCSGQICADQDTPSDCAWIEEYACYPAHGICERDADGVCGWRDTAELQACIDDANRTPVSKACVKNAGDACASDADCVSGGCGGELCYNPAVSDGGSTCECGPPQGVSCGCVGGACTWWE